MTATRIALGTAQFGSDYGIANTSGRPSKQNVFAVLEAAHRAGIDTLDTASAYGASETTIGEFAGKTGVAFNIISKLPDLDAAGTSSIQDLLAGSLNRLRQQHIYGYLVHKFDDIRRHPNVLADIEALKERELVRKTGFSAYKLDEIDYALEQKFPFDLVQVPYSLLDQRFAVHIDRLKAMGVEVHVRSVFLQGLFFLSPDILAARFPTAVEEITRARDISRDLGIPLNVLCLAFALTNDSIDRVVVGVDSVTQLEENLSAGEIDFDDTVRAELEQLRLEDEDVLLPYRWKS